MKLYVVHDSFFTKIILNAWSLSLHIYIFIYRQDEPKKRYLQIGSQASHQSYKDFVFQGLLSWSASWTLVRFAYG